jgi:hypothetical protein
VAFVLWAATHRNLAVAAGKHHELTFITGAIMSFLRKPHVAGTLLGAGLLLGVAAAQAASGYTVTTAQESLVRPGMTAAEVREALGHPAQDIHYRNEPGPTFTYRVVGDNDSLFDVDFGADGRVASTSERLDESGRGHGHGSGR